MSSHARIYVSTLLLAGCQAMQGYQRAPDASRVYSFEQIGPEGSRYAGEGRSAFVASTGVFDDPRRGYVQPDVEGPSCARATTMVLEFATNVAFTRVGAQFSPEHVYGFRTGREGIKREIHGGRLNVLAATTSVWEFEIVQGQLCDQAGVVFDDCVPQSAPYNLRVEGNLINPSAPTEVLVSADILDPAGSEALCMASESQYETGH